MNIKKNHILSTILHYIALPATLLGATILTYYPSLFYDFQFDDIANIKKFFDIRVKTLWNTAFTSSRWMSYCINGMYYQWGKFDPFYYRLGNLFFHVTTGVLIYFITIALLKKVKKESFFYKNTYLLASITALLFLLHPVQTQTVSYIIQGQLEGLSSLFMAATIFCFIAMMNASHIALRAFLTLVVTALVFISTGTKEIAIICPALLALIDWFFFAQGNTKQFLRRLPFYVFLLGIFMLQLGYRAKFANLRNIVVGKMELRNNIGNVITQTIDQKITRWDYFISQFKVILHYLWIFIWPWNISVDYDWKMVTSFSSEDCIIPFLILLVIACALLYRLYKNKIDLLMFGLVWFFVTLSPRTTFIPSTELVADYKTYFASYGLFFFYACLMAYGITAIIKQYFNKKNPALIYTFLLCAGVGALSYATYTRNKVWRSAEEFWLNIIQNAPKKARGYNNYAVSLAEKKKFEEAIPYLRKAIKLDPVYPDPWSNIAVCFHAINQIDMAIAQLGKALKINPYYPEFYNNLASFQLQKKNFPMVEELTRHAIKLRPHYGKAYFNLGQALYAQNRKEEAFEAVKTACLKADFDTIEGFHSYGQLSLELKKFEDAVVAFQHMCMIEPHRSDHHFNLANAYLLTKNYDAARGIYRNLIQQNPEEYRSWYNLAESYMETGDKADAIECFKKAEPLGKTVPQIALRIAQVVTNAQQSVVA